METIYVLLLFRTKDAFLEDQKIDSFFETMKDSRLTSSQGNSDLVVG